MGIYIILLKLKKIMNYGEVHALVTLIFTTKVTLNLWLKLSFEYLRCGDICFFKKLVKALNFSSRTLYNFKQKKQNQLWNIKKILYLQNLNLSDGILKKSTANMMKGCKEKPIK